MVRALVVVALVVAVALGFTLPVWKQPKAVEVSQIPTIAVD